MAAALEIPLTASFLLREKDNTVTEIRLNPESFSVLQEAIAVGLRLPASAQDFESRYERGIFQTFLERDPDVYDFALQVFVRTQNTCASFKFVFDDDMPTIGQLLARVADSAIDLLGVRLNVLVNNQTDEDIKHTLEELFQELERLNLAASDLAGMSESLSHHIVEFKVDSQKNSEDGSKLNDRWQKARISDDEWLGKFNENLNQLKEEMQRLNEQADVLGAQAQNAPPEDSFSWQILGATPDFIKQLIESNGIPFKSREELEDSFKRVEEEIRSIEDRADQDQEAFRNATTNIKSLQDTIHDIPKDAQNVASAISDINSAASRLITDNESLAKSLRYLREDLEMDAEVETRLDNLLNPKVDEISECLAMWKVVKSAGKKFSAR